MLQVEISKDELCLVKSHHFYPNCFNVYGGIKKNSPKNYVNFKTQLMKRAIIAA